MYMHTMHITPLHNGEGKPHYCAVGVGILGVVLGVVFIGY